MKPPHYLIFLFNFILFSTCQDIPGPLEPSLNCKILVPVQKSLTDTWLRVLDDAYKKFTTFVEKWASSTDALSLKKVGEFQVAANHCFDVLKGRTVTKIEELETTMKTLNVGLRKAISIGVCAVGELATYST
uniref:Pectinesterase inhibitor domain-containing protein n=1 Tax=Strigamia maritima TaxID=126957 RepID=T1ILT0_STRMM